MGLSPYRLVKTWLPLATVLQATAGCTPSPPAPYPIAQVTVEPSAASPARLAISGAHRHLWLIEADQQLMDVWIEVLDANGKVVHASDSPSRRGGPERAAVLLPRGSYTVRINSAEYPKKKARVPLKVERSAAIEGPMTDPWFRAELEETAAATAFRAGAALDGSASLSSYERAAAKWRRLGQTVRAATALYRAGWVSYRLMSDPAGASSKAETAAVMFAREGQRSLLAASLLLASSSRNDAANLGGKAADNWLARSRDDTTRARSIYEEFHNSYGIAEALQIAAQTEYSAGNFSRARELFREAETRYRHLGERDGLSRALVNAAQMDYALGNFREALATYDRIFAAGITESAPQMRADTLDNSGYAYAQIGDFENSLRQYLQALEIHQRVHDAGGVGRSLHGIGVTYLGLGNPQRALEYLQRAVTARKQAQDGAEIVAILLTLGNIHRELGDVAGAMAAHEDALRYARSGANRARVALALSGDHVAAGRYAEAERLLQAVLEKSASPDQSSISAQARLETGRVKIALGRPAAALPLLDYAAREFSRGGALIRQAEALHLISDARRRLGDLQTASREADRALTLVERMRASATNPELRARFLATRRAIYDLRVNMLLDEYSTTTSLEPHRDTLFAALDASELIRARSLTDLVATPIESNQIPAAAGRLSEDIATKGYRLESMLNVHTDPALIQSVRNDLADLHARYDAALSHLSTTASVAATAGSSWQRLPQDTAVLVYFLSAERSWLWIATNEGIRGHALPPRGVLTRTIGELVSGFSSSMPRRAHANDMARLLKSASAMLLPSDPVLHTRENWIVVPDGSIASVPFSALPLVDGDGDASLIEKHSVIFAATYRAALRAAATPAKLTLTHDRPALLFADPVYSLSDKRLERSSVALPTGAKRLPGTQREVSRIATHLRNFRPKVLLGFDASRDAVLSANARAAPLLHFAVHARSDAQALKAAAVQLSAYDSKGNSHNGLLTLADLAVTPLSADLVVLSSCDSAQGTFIDGEGSMSLAYGFLAAGARTVIATQWQVADAAMLQLMDKFYAAAAQGQPISRALRTAQLELKQTPAWREPAAWAATHVMVSY